MHDIDQLMCFRSMVDLIEQRDVGHRLAALARPAEEERTPQGIGEQVWLPLQLVVVRPEDAVSDDPHGVERTTVETLQFRLDAVLPRPLKILPQFVDGVDRVTADRFHLFWVGIEILIVGIQVQGAHVRF